MNKLILSGQGGNMTPVVYMPMCDASRALLKICKRDHLNSHELPLLKDLGFDIEIIGNLKGVVKELRELRMDYLAEETGIDFVGESV